MRVIDAHNVERGCRRQWILEARDTMTSLKAIMMQHYPNMA